MTMILFVTCIPSVYVYRYHSVAIAVLPVLPAQLTKISSATVTTDNKKASLFHELIASAPSKLKFAASLETPLPRHTRTMSKNQANLLITRLL